jgi:hypothetical protein
LQQICYYNLPYKMKRLLLLGTFILLNGSCSSQKTKILSKNEQVIEYMNTITIDELKKNLYVIASDEMKGRETGELGQKLAGNYIIEQYKKKNILYPKGATSYYQKVPAAFMNTQYSAMLKDSENIWAFIEGSEKPKEIVVVSAHYDHIGVQNGEVYNGADDDASGTVALIEIAKAFQKAKIDGYGPKRSILFLHVTGEEHGLHGSRFYTENPLFPLEKTIADVNIDMIGRRDELHSATNNYIYLIGSDYLSSDLYELCEEANTQSVNISLDYKFNDRKDPNRFYYRSDHYNFAKHNIPSVFLFNGIHADYHKASDEPDKIEYDALQKRAQLAFSITWELANRKKRPKVDHPGY